MSDQAAVILYREQVTSHCATVVARNVRNGFPDGSMDRHFEDVTADLIMMDWAKEERETRSKDLIRRILFGGK